VNTTPSELVEAVARIIEDRGASVLDAMLADADTPEKREYIKRNWFGTEVLAKAKAILALPALSTASHQIEALTADVEKWRHAALRIGKTAQAAEKQVSVLTAERDEARAAWAWLADRENLELSFGYPDIEDEGVWMIHERTGNRNDREWRQIATGSTPFETVESARSLLTQVNS
jgi:hypothetical protein